jgi:hypothetical protein
MPNGNEEPVLPSSVPDDDTFDLLNNNLFNIAWLPFTYDVSGNRSKLIYRNNISKIGAIS